MTNEELRTLINEKFDELRNLVGIEAERIQLLEEMFRILSKQVTELQQRLDDGTH